jgi:hypothetical protein
MKEVGEGSTPHTFLSLERLSDFYRMAGRDSAAT